MSKNIRKRILTLILTVMLLVPLSNQAFAESTPKIYGDNIKCKSGETVRYSVNISDNPGIAGFLISAACEDEWLNLDEEASMGDFSSLGNITSSHDAKRINALWFNPGNVSTDGTLFTFDVHVSPSTPSGKYPIDIFVSDENTLNDTYQKVDFEVIRGSITVEHGDTANVNSTEDTNTSTAWIISGAIGVAVIAVAILLISKKDKNNK